MAEYFNISIQQASLDFARYMFLAKDNMEYDRREKVYRATEAIQAPVLAPDTQTYLNEFGPRDGDNFAISKLCGSPTAM